MEDNTPILIIESNRALRELMLLSLSRLGYPVVTADSSEDVLEVVRDRVPVLIIMDLFLTRSNALELLTQIRNITTSPKIIIVSAFGYQEVVSKAIKAGANDFLIKPFDADELYSRARRIINAQ
jgi:DNA-binding response OmpR family regulator